MGKYALLHLKFYPCSPALLFGCHRPPFYRYPYDGEAKHKIGWGPRAICPGDKDDLVENANGMGHRLAFVRVSHSKRSLLAYRPREKGVAHSPAQSSPSRTLPAKR